MLELLTMVYHPLAWLLRVQGSPLPLNGGCMAPMLMQIQAVAFTTKL